MGSGSGVSWKSPRRVLKISETRVLKISETRIFLAKQANSWYFPTHFLGCYW